MTNILARRVSPIHVSFPLHRRPRFTVGVWRKSPTEPGSNTLTIEVNNASGAPVEVSEVSVGFLHTFLPAELLLGKKSATFPLTELAGDPTPPQVVSGSVKWTADLDQVREELVQEQLRWSARLRRTYANLTVSGYPHVDRFYAELADIDVESDDGRPRGRLAIKVNNLVRELTQKRLAVVVRYGEGGLYKAKARWEPPPFAQRYRPH